MNNFHRELAPISDSAWAEIEEGATRTLKRHLAARRVVDVVGPKGLDFSAVGTGHVRQIQAPADGVQSLQREVKALVELRVPFELSRQAIDDVERGAGDSDWLPVKEAARKIAFAEDSAVLDGYAAAGIEGIRKGGSNPGAAFPPNAKAYSGAIAQTVSQLRLAGVNGPYALVLGAMPTPPPAAKATKAIPSCITSSASWTDASSGRRPLPAASCFPLAAAISSSISARISRSAIQATPAQPSSFTSRKASSSASSPPKPAPCLPGRRNRSVLRHSSGGERAGTWPGDSRSATT